jgi:SHS2 domain-containing protein
MRRYRMIDHTADMGVYLYGRDPKEVFLSGAAVLFELMVEGRPKGPGKWEALALDGLDREDLLVQWLGEFLYIFSARGQVLTHARIHRLTRTRIEAEIELADFDPERYERRTEIKAVTYHQAEFKRHGAGWRARVIFDV